VKQRPVSRLGRKLDIVSLIFLACGAALFAAAFVGMAAIRDERARETQHMAGQGEVWAAYNRYVRLQRLSWLGMGMGAAGIAIALSAAVHNRRFRNHVQEHQDAREL
jgi:hypothetical protein